MHSTVRDGDVVIVTPPAQLTDRAVDRMLADLRKILLQRKPYALVFDMRGARVPSPIQRKKLSDHIAEHDRDIRDYVRGMAMIAPSAVLRGIVTAVFWLAPPPIEWRLFDTQDEAVRWAKQRLDSPLLR